MPTRRHTLFRQSRHRLVRDQGGFTVVESLIAVTIILASLTSLVYAVTQGFGYVAASRDQQAANQIANQIMEEARSLPFGTITRGLKSTDITGPDVVTGCIGDAAGVYRLTSCSGDKVVNGGSSLSNVVPLVPNSGTCPGSGLPLCPAGAYPASYSWRTWITNNDTVRNPYKVTVLVSWTNSAMRLTDTKSIRLESTFWSPTGCVSEQTHPFAGPCPAFFHGTSQLPQSLVTVSKSSFTGVANTSFTSGFIHLTQAQADIQQEQVYRVQGFMGTSGCSITDGAGTRTGGANVAQTVAADGDPTSTAPTYSPGSTTGTAGSCSSTSGGGNPNSITIRTPPATPPSRAPQRPRSLRRMPAVPGNRRGG